MSLALNIRDAVAVFVFDEYENIDIRLGARKLTDLFDKIWWHRLQVIGVTIRVAVRNRIVKFALLPLARSKSNLCDQFVFGIMYV